MTSPTRRGDGLATDVFDLRNFSKKPRAQHRAAPTVRMMSLACAFSRFGASARRARLRTFSCPDGCRPHASREGLPSSSRGRSSRASSAPSRPGRHKQRARYRRARLRASALLSAARGCQTSSRVLQRLPTAGGRFLRFKHRSRIGRNRSSAEHVAGATGVQPAASVFDFSE